MVPRKPFVAFVRAFGRGRFARRWEMFKEVGEPNFPKLEEEVLAFWKREKIFQKSVENRKGGPPVGGPPFGLSMVKK